MTLPITSCENERSVSSLRRLKTYLQSTMAEDSLNGLALLHIHRSIELDVERVIDLFARRQTRRMALVDILDD
jgi:hypothetical protein